MNFSSQFPAIENKKPVNTAVSTKEKEKKKEEKEINTKSRKENIFDLYWVQMKSRVVVAEKLELTEEELFNDFAKHKIPMRYESILYGKEFSKLYNVNFKAEGEEAFSDLFYCPAFRQINLCLKLTFEGTIYSAYIRPEVWVYDENKTDYWVMKAGFIGFLPLNDNIMPIQASYTFPINGFWCRIRVVAVDAESELSDTVYYQITNAKGFFS